ncbi:golgin subfamily A member 6-like protein 1 isoform X2 [Zerene cesonia]|uniref:golgin subfamily A member 6-like protein 1 isoform X2 n=1 Tax=Zerene cesonia TaxID=33412 RepID=UPI0018E4F3AA|nr:golgin subfamily A member 6-like protein 1 isoform X2 [Zerene cesonia]
MFLTCLQHNCYNFAKNQNGQKMECSTGLLSKKLKEFNSENEMLNGLLHTGQNEFLKEFGEIMEFLRKCINETMPLQLRNEQLTYELSELNSKIIDLRKQLHTAEQLKSQNHRAKIEELEKELKEEKMERASLRKRLTRCNGQVKIEEERSTNLEAALNQAQIQTRNLERTVLQLQEQNERLQCDFDTELNKLNESIKENTAHLEEIADAREKLQLEKEDLEKRLEELSTHYTESLSNLRHELNSKISLLIEAEKKYSIEIDEKKRLQEIVETQCAQLVEAELRNKDISQKLQELETQSSERERKLKFVESELLTVKSENKQYQQRLIDQENAIKEFEEKFKESRMIEERLRNDLKNKDDCLSTLENKKSHLEKQLRDSESKMELYEEQLSSLKTHILQLQECFGEYENINDLREMLNLQKNKVQEITRHNNELAETLQRRNIDLEVHMETIGRQEHALQQNNEIIKVLSQKEEEQANIIKLLRNNLEIRSQKDSELNRQLVEKKEKIDVLINSLDTRKGQISQLKKIILTLEDQIRDISQQKRNNDEKIDILEQQNQEYKLYMEDRNDNESRTKNLDTLFEILEDELGNSFEQQYEYNIENDPRNKCTSKHIEQQLKQDFPSRQKLFDPEYEKNRQNINMNNFENKPFNYKKDKKESVNRKKTTQLETLKWISGCDRKNTFARPIRETVTVGHSKDKYITRNLPPFVQSNFKDDRQYKMLKLASHRM